MTVEEDQTVVTESVTKAAFIDMGTGVAPADDGSLYLGSVRLPGGPQSVIDVGIEYGNKWAAIVRANPKMMQKISYNNRSGGRQSASTAEHVRLEGWTILGAMFGCSVVEESCIRTRGVDRTVRNNVRDGSTSESAVSYVQFEATYSVVRNMDGMVIGRAGAVCRNTEPFWTSAQEYAIRSMACTRAASRALRFTFGFVATLVGMESTPAEEVEDIFRGEKASVDRWMINAMMETVVLAGISITNKPIEEVRTLLKDKFPDTVSLGNWRKYLAFLALVSAGKTPGEITEAEIVSADLTPYHISTW